MADKTKKPLLSDFPGITTEQWMEKITADLKGADFERKLVWKTNEGFNVRPFYRSEDLNEVKYLDSLPGEFPYVRGTKKDNDWYVRQDINAVDADAANAKALDVLTKGITSLGFALCEEVKDAEEFMMEALEAGAEDIVEEEGEYQVITDPADFQVVLDALTEAGYKHEEAEVTMLPENKVNITDLSVAKKVLALYDTLDTLDDVQEVYSNFDIPEEILNQLD